MNAIFSENDSNIAIYMAGFQGNLSLYYNHNTNQVGFLDREIHAEYPEWNALEQPEDILSIQDPKKRNIYLILKHSYWISPVLLKAGC